MMKIESCFLSFFKILREINSHFNLFVVISRIFSKASFSISVSGDCSPFIFNEFQKVAGLCMISQVHELNTFFYFFQLGHGIKRTIRAKYRRRGRMGTGHYAR